MNTIKYYVSLNYFSKDDVNIEINASEIKKITKAKSNLKIKIEIVTRH